MPSFPNDLISVSTSFSRCEMKWLMDLQREKLGLVIVRGQAMWGRSSETHISNEMDKEPQSIETVANIHHDQFLLPTG